MWYISYWFYPVFSSLVWLAMLIAMLVWWVEQGKPHYDSMSPNQTIAYISGKCRELCFQLENVSLSM